MHNSTVVQIECIDIISSLDVDGMSYFFFFLSPSVDFCLTKSANKHAHLKSTATGRTHGYKRTYVEASVHTAYTYMCIHTDEVGGLMCMSVCSSCHARTCVQLQVENVRPPSNPGASCKLNSPCVKIAPDVWRPATASPCQKCCYESVGHVTSRKKYYSCWWKWCSNNKPSVCTHGR